MKLNELSDTEELKPCPFCGVGTTNIRENTMWMGGTRPSQILSVGIQHWCLDSSIGFTLYGKTREQAIKRWNTRVG